MDEEAPPEKPPPEKPPASPEASPERALAVPADPFTAAKGRFVLACAGIAGGLAVAGTLDRTSGGVIVLAGWLAGILALHRLGRAGSTPRP